MSIYASACSTSIFFSGGGSFGVVACYSDYSSIHSFDCFGYSDFLSIANLHYDSNSGICSDMHCPHTTLVVVDYADSHIGSTLQLSALTNTP